MPGKYERDGGGDEQFRKLFIGGLNAQTDDNSLRSFYEQWGELTDCVVMKDKNSGRSRGFGFVTYKNPENLEACMAARPHTIDEKTVEAKRAAPREFNNDPRTQATVKKMFLGGYKDEITEEDLREYFQSYGSIQEINILSEPNAGKKRGFCFVTFDDYDAVDKACLERYHTIKGHRLEAQKALTREQMAEIKQKQSGNSSHHGGGSHSQSYGGGNGGYGGGNGGGWHGNGAPPPPPAPYMGYPPYGPPPGGYPPYGYGYPPYGYPPAPGGYGQPMQPGYQGGYAPPPPQGGAGPNPYSMEMKQDSYDGNGSYSSPPQGGAQTAVNAGGPGPMRGGSFTSRAAGPYGGSYGPSGGGRR